MCVRMHAWEASVIISLASAAVQYMYMRCTCSVQYVVPTAVKHGGHGPTIFGLGSTAYTPHEVICERGSLEGLFQAPVVAHYMAGATLEPRGRAGERPGPAKTMQIHRNTTLRTL
jgi:hypothetical protein